MSVLFSRGCEYALRGLVEMARHPEQEYWTILDLASRTETPAPFLAKTFQQLVRAKLLRSAKGRGGGFAFARPPQEISVIGVVETLDGDALAQECALGLPECSEANPCPFHRHWKGIRESILEALTAESLADFANENKREGDSR